jgi:positive regulator of sigma E activity
MGIIFIVSVIASHAIFDDIYITCFVSVGILFLGYMGYATYSRDQERKAQDKINGRLQAMSNEIAMKQARPGKKNGRL